VTEWDPKSASKSTAGLVVTGGDRGDGRVNGWTADVAGRPATPECVDVGRCTGCVWFAAAAAVAG